MSLNSAPRKIAASLVALGACAALLTTPTSAEVRFGINVRIGGHDFSNQTYNSKRRAVIRLYDRTPRNAGCVWRSDRRGGKVKVCNLRSLR
jgi:hypothetical protein